MKIAKDHVVRFHYTVAEVGQPQLESSHEREPMAILFGQGNIIPGLEQAMEGKAEGEKFSVEIPAEQAYGERQDNLNQRLPKKYFKNAKLVPGMQVVLPTSQGPRPMTVLKVGASVVDVDLNHPVAGKARNVEVEIIEVRAAEAEELEHGHVHGKGGVEH